jgi:hypothetical protein
MSNEVKYSIEVFEDYAIVHGFLTSQALKILIHLCKIEGFTHLTTNNNGYGFKLIRKQENDN